MIALVIAVALWISGFAVRELGDVVARWFNNDWVSFPFGLAALVLWVLAFLHVCLAVIGL